MGFAAVLVLIELIYFAIARRYQILDNPNNRSLHGEPTIRGGGIIFPLAMVLFTLQDQHVSPYFLTGLLLVSTVGFLDDLRGLSRTVRFAVQAAAMMMVFYDLQIVAHAWWVTVLVLMMAVSTINAYNFMDGINGITAGYSLVVITALYFIDTTFFQFENPDLLIAMILALVVFSFFNFRAKAICFAGDVGSLAIGFSIIYLILRVSFQSGNYIFVLLLAVYGVDSALTIAHRLMLRQNIFKAHRLHLYQVIISTTGLPHLVMTGIYMSVQAVISSIVIYNLRTSSANQYLTGALILLVLSLVYLVLKRHYYKRLTHGV